MPYDDPFRLRLLKEVTTCLEGITVANGYKYNMAGKVFRGRQVFGEGDELPLIVILETPVPIDQIPSPETSTGAAGDLDLLIQGFIDDDSKNPTDPGHYLMADVKKALAKERRRSGEMGSNGRPKQNILNMDGKVTDLIIGSGTVRQPDEISSVAYFWLRITLKIVEDNEQPYM